MGFSGSGGSGLNGVEVTNSPVSGQTIEATSPTQAEWITGGGGPPTGAAGGDLSGVYPDPVVSQINGAPLPLGLPNGGTGAANAQNAINTLAGAVTVGQYLRGNGINVVMAGIQAADVPVLNQNTSGNAATATEAAGLESATGTVVVSGAAAPTAGQVLTATGATAADWQTISAGSAEYLAIHQYAPAVLAQPVANTASMAAFDSANITTGNFTAPASGAVIVKVHAVLSLNTGNTAFGLAAHGTITPMISNLIILDSPTSVPFQYACLTFYISGLTPGDTYAYDLLGASSVAPTVSATLDVQGITATTPSFAADGGPVLITVETAI